MLYVETLPGALHAREELLGGYGEVHEFAFPRQAVVAPAAARTGIGFAEVGQERDASADFGFGELDHAAELQAGRPLFHALFVGDEGFHPVDVRRREEQYTLGGQAVAPGAADFLVVALEVLRKVVVDDEPDVGLVDAHAEGDGGHHDEDVVAHETLLVVVPLSIRQTRVVGADGKPLRRECRAQGIHPFSRRAINDAGIVGVPAEDLHRLTHRIVLVYNPDEKILPVEARHEFPRCVEAQRAPDVPAYARGGGRRERDADGVRDAGPHGGELPVLRPKVMAPLGDAVGFVDGQARDRHGIEQGEHLPAKQRFRGDIEELRFPAPNALHVPPIALRRQGAVQKDRRHAEHRESVHLVLHEGDERRNDHGEPRKQEGGDLEAERLAAPRRHDRKTVPTLQHAPDHFFL